METIIHNPKDIVVGKLYKAVSKVYRESTLYLGGYNNDTFEKFLIIVVFDEYDGFYVGRTVCKPDNTNSSLWVKGFEEQDTTY